MHAAENGIENVLELAVCRRRTCTRWSCRCSCSRLAYPCSSATGPNLMFLSLTDFIQHKVCAGPIVPTSFFTASTTKFAATPRPSPPPTPPPPPPPPPAPPPPPPRHAELGAVWRLTADHAMNDQVDAQASRNVITCRTCGPNSASGIPGWSARLPMPL